MFIILDINSNFLFFRRIQGEDALSKLTRFGHTHFEKGYMELDKQVFSLLLALNVIE